MMSRKFQRHYPEDRPIAFLKKVADGDMDAWKKFVEQYSGFLYSLAWRYARGDVDVASELVLVVLEGLVRQDAKGQRFYRLRSYLNSMDRFGGRSRFTTWLALVAKNLFRDWFRERDGRRILPKQIEGLDSIDQEVFRLLFWEGYLENETVEKIRSQHPTLSFEDVKKRIEKIYENLSDRNLSTIYQDLLRRMPTLSMGSTWSPESFRPLDIADSSRESRPDWALEQAEEQAFSQDLRKLIHKTVQELPATTRNVVLLHIFQGLSGEEVCRIMGFRKRQRVYDEIAKAKKRIGSVLRKAGVDAEQADLAIGWLEDES